VSADALNKPMPVELELMAEKAGALGLAASKLEAALTALDAADQALESAPPERRERQLAVRRERRAEAARRLWYLVVQREALGLRSHEEVFRVYRVPPDVKVYAGR
jgi:hypothetical protein